MITNKDAILWVYSFNLSRKKIKCIISCFLNASDMFENFTSKKQEIIQIVGKTKFDIMCQNNNLTYLQERINFVNSFKLKILTEEDFSEELREIDDAPVLLFALGNVELLHENTIAIVGTRKPSRYGKEMSFKFAYDLAKAGICIISGLAFGIDSEAHKGAIAANGKTIAVLGGGLDDIYPKENTNLARCIVKNQGLLLSEYWPKFRPTKYTFPERNRIVSGISKGVLLIEAGETSGSLHTANFAFEQGKEFFILPSNANSIQNAGGNKLLSVVPHAFTLDVNHILDTFGWKIPDIHKKDDIQLSTIGQQIYDIVKINETHVDELAETLRISSSELATELSILEIEGVIKRLPGNYIGV